MNELRFALRQLRKSPPFTFIAILTLALGIGANTAIFSLVHTMIFKPRGFAELEQVVQLYSQDKKNPKKYGVSALDPVAFTVAPVVLALAGLIATWLPARRAARISPMDALRSE